MYIISSLSASVSVDGFVPAAESGPRMQTGTGASTRVWYIHVHIK